MAGAAIACAWIGLPAVAFLPVAAGIALAWGWHLGQVLQWGTRGVRTLVLAPDGGTRWQDGSGQWNEGSILPGSYVSGWLVVVNLDGGGRHVYPLVLLPDSAAAEELRRLRVWLRWRLAKP